MVLGVKSNECGLIVGWAVIADDEGQWRRPWWWRLMTWDWEVNGLENVEGKLVDWCGIGGLGEDQASKIIRLNQSLRIRGIHHVDLNHQCRRSTFIE